MGTWGAGNLDSDGALDIVGDRSAALTQSVWRALQSRTSWEADETAYDRLFVELEIMLALADAKLFSGYDLPDPAAVKPVLTTWLEGWSAYFDGLAGPKFKAERRAVIEATFARFEQLCAEAAERRS